MQTTLLIIAAYLLGGTLLVFLLCVLFPAVKYRIHRLYMLVLNTVGCVTRAFQLLRSGEPKDGDPPPEWAGVCRLVDAGLRNLAGRTDAENQVVIGNIYYLGAVYDGVGGGSCVPLDYKMAIKCYTLAAERGHAGAQCALGSLYFGDEWLYLHTWDYKDFYAHKRPSVDEAGQSIPADYNTALKWYTLAAKQGMPDAEVADAGVGRILQAARKRAAKEG